MLHCDSKKKTKDFCCRLKVFENKMLRRLFRVER
jgi:hypothetical protein